MGKKFQNARKAQGSPPANAPKRNGAKGDTHSLPLPSGWDPVRTLAENPVALILTDREKRVLWWNERAEQLLELSPESSLNQSLHQALGILEFSLPEPKDPSKPASPSIPQVEINLRTPSGKTLSLEVCGGILPSREQDPLQWSFVDVSWRKEIEVQIHNYTSHVEMACIENEAAKKDAEAESQAKSSFLANMSHEIRTPMTAILGFAETLQDPGLSREEIDHAIETIHRNGSYLLGIINDILDLSKIDAGRMTLEAQTIDLRNLLFDVRDLLGARATGKGIVFRIEAPDGLPSHFRSDPLRLRQILINLVGNAIKFTHEGEVVLRVRRAPKEGGLLFEVADTGIGLSPEQAKRIFDPFSQADASTTRKYGGTGLGLSICKRLCQILGGELTLTSTEGIGSTFRFSLPLEEGALEPPWQPLDAPKEKKPRKKKKVPRLQGRVLLAEDGPDNQRLISYLIRKTGAELQLVEDGRQALEKGLEAWEADHPYDLILMDLQMPEMDGFEATQCLRDRGYQGPILALTAHGMSAILDQATQAGCDGWITKPIEREAFFKALSSHLQKSPEKTQTS